MINKYFSAKCWRITPLWARYVFVINSFYGLLSVLFLLIKDSNPFISNSGPRQVI